MSRKNNRILGMEEVDLSLRLDLVNLIISCPGKLSPGHKRYHQSTLDFEPIDLLHDTEELDNLFKLKDELSLRLLEVKKNAK